MSKEILLVAEAVSNEKGVSPEVIFEAIEIALANAAMKDSEEEGELDIKVNIDRKTGDYETWQCWKVVDNEQVPNLGNEITMEEAEEINSELQPGDMHQEKIKNALFGRIAAQAGKQIIYQKVREAERAKVLEMYKDQVGEIISGTVKKVTRDKLIIDLGGNAEALLPRDQLIGREAFRIGERVRACLMEIVEEGRGPGLLLSRTSSAMMTELFNIEVPEIQEELIDMLACARDPGSRAKVAVKTNDGRIDPVGACVGMRGARVQAISNELAGERVDIILWDDNPAQLVINAMAPAQVASIIVDEESNAMDVAVEADQLAIAIGRSGQNVRLASELTGWTINVMTEAAASEKQQAEQDAIVSVFESQMDLDEDLASLLVDEGFTSVEEIAYVPREEMLEIEDLDEDIVDALRQRAKDVLLTQELASEERLENSKPSQELIEMEGMEEGMAVLLAAEGIVTLDDLAEKAIDELMDIENLTEQKAGELIMTARASWFENE
jgi:transcription termination/antitermination protein NusA